MRCLVNLSIVASFKNPLKAFYDFRDKQQNVWSNVFWYVKVCIFWSMYILYIEIKHKSLKKIPLGKINGTKNALCFLLRASTHHSFSFNLRFLFELKHKVCLSKSAWEIFHFRYRFVFIKVYTFVQQNAWTLWL